MCKCPFPAKHCPLALRQDPAIGLSPRAPKHQAQSQTQLADSPWTLKGEPLPPFAALPLLTAPAGLGFDHTTSPGRDLGLPPPCTFHSILLPPDRHTGEACPHCGQDRNGSGVRASVPGPYLVYLLQAAAGKFKSQISGVGS